jgi:hypothetical protein
MKEDVMTQQPPEGSPLEEEPQEARGAPGSRDKGHPPGQGPAERPAAKRFGPRDQTSINPQEPIDEDMPYLPPGDQGG